MYKVIIVDDEPIIVKGLERAVKWEALNCTVVGTAGNGIEGIEIIRREKPDILISDISMPNMDGLRMIAALKSEFPDMEVTILTGFRDFDYAQEAIRLGVCRFLLKPSKMEEIQEALEVMIANLRNNPAVRLNNGEQDVKAAGAEGTEASGSEENLDNAASSFIVKNAIAYIALNYKERLKLADVADNVYVSQWHLSKLLNKFTGQNFSEILNNVRMDQAKKLLENPSLRIGDIAEEVGFLDMAHFSRVFKKQVGVSANEYRNTVLCIHRS